MGSCKSFGIVSLLYIPVYMVLFMQGSVLKPSALDTPNVQIEQLAGIYFSDYVLWLYDCWQLLYRVNRLNILLPRSKKITTWFTRLAQSAEPWKYTKNFQAYLYRTSCLESTFQVNDDIFPLNVHTVYLVFETVTSCRWML
jgi:hypothetical protein